MEVPNPDREKWRRCEEPPGRLWGETFESSHGRHIEIKYEPGDEWAVDLTHYYGCTRIALEDTRAEAHDKLVETLDSFPKYLGYYRKS